MFSSMSASVDSLRCPNDPTPRCIDEQALDFGLDARHVAVDLTTQRIVVAQILWRNPLNQLLGLLNKSIEVNAAVEIQVLEAVEKLREIADRGIPKDPTFAVFTVTQPFRQVR